jgi:hypothetical protein
MRPQQFQFGDRPRSDKTIDRLLAHPSGPLVEEVDVYAGLRQ